METQKDLVRVLIVDDYEITRTGLRLTLEQQGQIQVVGEAGDGRTAVSKTLELSPDVVVMDLGLPILDGIEATREIKDRVPNTNVIILTSHNREEDVFASLAAGANGYCLKDISCEQLSIAIVAVSKGVAWLDPLIAQQVLQASSSPTPTKVCHNQYSLSERELQVLSLVVDGLSNQEIAKRLFLSPDTIKSHMRKIMEKLAVSDRTQAAVKALRQGMV